METAGTSAALRFLQLERAEEVLPLLLEEILRLGFPRSLILKADLEVGDIQPVAALKCSRQFLDRFRTSLFALDNPLVTFLQQPAPTVLDHAPPLPRSVYLHPLVFRKANRCWEADARRSECLAAENDQGLRRFNLEGQSCKTCQMLGHVYILAVQIPAEVSAEQVRELGAMAELANHFLTRLTKSEQYFTKMRSMQLTISRMNTVMSSMADPVILTDTQHRVLMQNEAAARLFRVPERATEGLLRAIELNNMLFSAMLSSMAMDGGANHRDLTLVDSIDGEELLLEAVTVPSYGDDGMLSGMVTVMRDVTDLRRADQELQANYERLREAETIVRQDRDRLNLIVENVGDPIVVCDTDGKPVLMDPLAQSLFASGSEQVNDPIRIKNQAVLDAYIASFTYSFTLKETQTLRLTDPTTHEDVDYEARSGKIFDERSQVAYTVTVLRDWSAVRKLEQLKLERRMLEIEKFAAAGQLAATIAHEVNNPMEAIKNAIYLLAGMVKPEASPVYDILKSETERVARIVRQMLGLYRSSTSQSVRPININMLMEDTLLLLNRQLQRNNVEVVAEFSDLPDAVVSSDQLRQVFSNMIINAKDSMPNGGRLRLRTRYVRTSGRRELVRVLIADTGCGIPENIVRTMYEPFVTTKGEKGTGLGLWIVKGIIANHGGRIAVRSRQGAGTVFKLDIPVVR